MSTSISCVMVRIIKGERQQNDDDTHGPPHDEEKEMTEMKQVDEEDNTKEEDESMEENMKNEVDAAILNMC